MKTYASLNITDISTQHDISTIISNLLGSACEGITAIQYVNRIRLDAEVGQVNVDINGWGTLGRLAFATNTAHNALEHYAAFSKDPACCDAYETLGAVLEELLKHRDWIRENRDHLPMFDRTGDQNSTHELARPATIHTAA